MKQVFLREHSMADLEAYLDWQCSESVGKYLSWLPRSKEEATRSLEDAILEQQNPERQRFFMAVVRIKDSEIVGEVGITRVSQSEVNIGWFLRPGFEGQGYAYAGAKLMVQFCEGLVGVTTIRASCHRSNKRSEHIMKKLNFSLEKSTNDRVWYVYFLE